MKRYKILFLAAFEEVDVNSTNIMQRDALVELGHQVIDCSYRLFNNVPEQTLDLIHRVKPDITVMAKGKDLTLEHIDAANKYGRTVMWMMDYTHNWSEDLESKIASCTKACLSRASTTEMALMINPASHFVPEGFDPDVHYPPIETRPALFSNEVSHIGALHGNACHFDREKLLACVGGKNIIAYGHDHRKAVWSTKINLNFSEGDGTSDRLYKILGAGGFCLTQYFRGIEQLFDIGAELDVFSCPRELQLKTIHYLSNPDKMRTIARRGMKIAHKSCTNLNWAKGILLET
jgi:spore maturation protein CgeB